MWAAFEAHTEEVIHGRLRTKTNAKIAKDECGVVEGMSADFKYVTVKVTAVVAEKNKSITSDFAPEILEVVKHQEKPEDEKPNLVGNKKQLAFLNGGGGTALQVIKQRACV